MPTLSATTTAVFASLGVTASSIYAVFVSLASTALDFGLWTIQVGWPFLLIVGFIILMWKIASRFLGFSRH